MNDYVQATVTVLALINPATSAAIFAKVETGAATSGKAVAATSEEASGSTL